MKYSSITLSTFFVLLLVLAGVPSAHAEGEITGCLKLKRNGKLKRFAEGDTPTKNCKGNETQVSLPTTERTNDLQAQIDSIVTSSMIGGAHKSTDSTTDELVRWMGMYITRLGISQPEIRQKMSAAGGITKLSVVTKAGPGGANTAKFQLTTELEGSGSGDRLTAPLETSADLECTLIGDETMCQVEGCVPVEMGMPLSVRIVLESTDGSEAFLNPARWNARFVEGLDCDDSGPGGFTP